MTGAPTDRERGRQRIMILTTTTGYQTRAFVSAAAALGVEIAIGSDRCHVLDDPWRDGALALRFEDPDGSARLIASYARDLPLNGIVALGDRPVATLGRACELLGLPGHTPLGGDLCRDKFLSHVRLHRAGVLVPRFARFSVSEASPEILAGVKARIGFPCVVKPLGLSASQGVMRANDGRELARSIERLRAILRAPGVQVMREEANRFIQIEEYVGGSEIAVEGLVDRGAPHILAVFDKPDPLEGPFFEETIYVTPSRLEDAALTKAARVVTKAARTLGLYHGPFHAELRVSARGVYLIDIAARSIGGLCSKAVRFLFACTGRTRSLETLLTELALGRNVHPIQREECASGVMMIPIEREGILAGVDGLDEAQRVAGVEEIIITAKPGQRMIPFPEGCSYPGFIFARGDSPAFVESALRAAHKSLRFQTTTALPVAR